MVVHVLSVQDNVHYVRLLCYSMEHHFFFNDYIAKLIAKVIDERGDVFMNDEKQKALLARYAKIYGNANRNEESQAPRVPRYFYTKPSNYEVITELISRAFRSPNVVDDDQVPLVQVEISDIVSPFEFYAIPQIGKTQEHYRMLFNQFCCTMSDSEPDPDFHLDVPSAPLAYYNQSDKWWHRGTILKITPTPELEKLLEVSLLDYDTGRPEQLYIMKENIGKYFRPLPELFRTKPQAIRCVIPVFGLATSASTTDEEDMLKHLQNFIKIHENNLFILPLTELSTQQDSECKFVVNLYFREMMLIGMFQPQKQHFECYLSGVKKKFANKLKRLPLRHSLPSKFDFLENIYRNLCANNFLNADKEDQNNNWSLELSGEEKTTWNYIRMHYPNVQHFVGVITCFTQERNRLFFRYETNEDPHQQVQSRLVELALQDAQDPLPRIEKTLTELYPCVALDPYDRQWYRVEILELIEEKQAPWLPKIRVRQVDTGAIVMYQIEDLRDSTALPEIPMLAVPCHAVCYDGLYAKLAQSIGKMVKFNWLVRIYFKTNLCLSFSIYLSFHRIFHAFQ